MFGSFLCGYRVWFMVISVLFWVLVSVFNGSV